MKLSLKQALVMLDVLKASLQLDVNIGGYSLKIRQQVVHAIINQQSDDLVNIEPENIVWDWEYLEDDGDKLFGTDND